MPSEPDPAALRRPPRRVGASRARGLRPRLFVQALLALLAVTSAAVSNDKTPPGELVDRILAVVNDTPLLLSEVRAVEVLRSLDPSKALEAAIDERLMHQEASRLPQAAVSEEEVQEAVRSLLEKRPELAERLSQEELGRLLRRQLSILKYIEFRFRPQIRVTDQEVREAWDEAFEGAPQGPPFEEAEPELRERLERRELDQRIEEWIRELRQRAEVRYVEGPGSPPPAPPS
jgi:hypothetical protein